MLNQYAMKDVRNVLTGKDGVFYNDSGEMIATATEFTVQVSVSNAKYQPLGYMQEMEAAQSYSVSLNFKQVVIESDDMIKEFMECLAEGTMPSWNFQGSLKGRNGSYERMTYRSCIPTGTVDLQNFTVGDVISRSWSFTVNEPPKMLSYLTASSS